MLSSQTKDEVTDAAVNKLRTALGGALSVQAVLDADESIIADAIAKVGFWRRKTQCVYPFLGIRACLMIVLDDRPPFLVTRYIKQTAKRLHDDFEGDVPKTVDELCSLPGVGPKMAFLALQVAWKLCVPFFFFFDHAQIRGLIATRARIETSGSVLTCTSTGSRTD